MALSYLEKEDENEIITQDAMLKEVDIGSATKVKYYKLQANMKTSVLMLNYSMDRMRLIIHETAGKLAAKRL